VTEYSMQMCGLLTVKQTGLRSAESGKGGVRSLPNPSRCCLHIRRRSALFPFQLLSFKNTEIPQYSYFILNYKNHAVETVSLNNPEKRQAILCRWYPCISNMPERFTGRLTLIINLSADIELASCRGRLHSFVKWPITQFKWSASEPVQI
jgi:hypothetical protein